MGVHEPTLEKWQLPQHNDRESLAFADESSDERDFAGSHLDWIAVAAWSWRHMWMNGYR